MGAVSTPAEKQTLLLSKALESRSLLLVYAHATLRDWSLAEDAVQEAIIALNNSWQNVDEKKLLPWLHKVTKNKAIDIIRRRSRRQERESSLQEIIDQHFDRLMNDDLNQKVINQEKALGLCIQSLSETSKNVIVGFYKENKSCSILAKIHSRSINSIRLLLTRSRKQLRKCADERLGELI